MLKVAVSYTLPTKYPDWWKWWLFHVHVARETFESRCLGVAVLGFMVEVEVAGPWVWRWTTSDGPLPDEWYWSWPKQD